MQARNGAFLLMVALAFGCGGEGAQTEQADTAEPAVTETAPAATMAAPSGPIDEALASEGEGYFQSRGCVGCHQLDTRLIGPALRGVTERREYDWFVGMTVRPDSMLRDDATAKELLAEYGTPMVPMGTTVEEARAIYEYLRQASQ
jgi:mono/diheme cytochrome c family protein